MLVLYIILFIASIFFYILYVGSFSFYLFAFLLVMPIILFVMLKKMSKKISVGFVNTQKTAGRSSKIPVVLRLQNRSKLPVANMIIEIEYYNTLDGDKNTMKINTPLYPDDVQYLTLHVSAKHYGTVRMNIKRCRIVDMLKLFKIRVSTDAASSVSCLFCHHHDIRVYQKSLRDHRPLMSWNNHRFQDPFQRNSQCCFR